MIDISNLSKSQLKVLDDVKEHTLKKGDFVAEYLEEFLYVGANKWNQVTYIDAMSNAGVYRCGTEGTSIKVMRRMIILAKKYPEKQFNFIVNDYKLEKIEILHDILEKMKKGVSNISTWYFNEDVNDFFNVMQTHDTNRLFQSALSITFIDPYNYGYIDMIKMIEYMNSRRTELILNLFTSDIRRNLRNEQAKNHMKMINDSLTSLGVNTSEEDITVLTNDIATRLRDAMKRINFAFRYPFHNNIDQEIYSLLFLTGHIKGIKKFKRAIWKTFDGSDRFVNSKNKMPEGATQLSLLDEDEIEKIEHFYKKDLQGKEMIKLIKSEFKGKDIWYNDIEEIVLENSLLGDNHIVTYVIKPMLGKELTKLTEGKAYKGETLYRVGE